MQIVAPARFLDGVVFAVFLLFVSGAGLYMFGEFHKMVVITNAKKLGPLATAMENVFPFPAKKFAFNLTHVLLFAILICLLSMTHHPAQDMVQTEAEKELKKEKKKKEEKEKAAAKGE
mmetsp:Transcript_18545/g.38579  ORF Transcript_18545/g.38579 Transcript_18545/m.38579 type:complete len:118 (+) Transcript_18545:59-412(+)